MRVGIIGGGISGLTAAYYLLKAGHQVTVFEAAPTVGGLASSIQVQGAWVDKFYHCILPSDTALLSLVEDLGLGGDVYWRETEMGFVFRGRLYPLTTPLDLLRFSALSITGRLRLGVLGLYSRFLRDWRPLEKVTAKDWVTRFCGEEVFNTVWKPLLAFKFGDHYEQAPATYLWSRVKRQATTRKDRSPKEVLAYVRGGFKRITEVLVGEIKKLGGVITTNVKVEHIETQDGRVRGVTLTDGFQPFDKVVSTVPLVQFSKLVPSNLWSENGGDRSIAYQGVVCVLLILKQPLSRFYWMPVVESGVSFSGIVETTALIHPEDLGGHHLAYLVNYVSRESPSFSEADTDVIARSVAELQTLFNTFHPGQIVEAHVFRAALVEPMWTVNYSKRIPQRAWLGDSLFVLTTAQLYPDINSTSNCVKQVKEVFDRLVA